MWSHLLKKSLMENFVFCAVETLPFHKNLHTRKLGEIKVFSLTFFDRSKPISCQFHFYINLLQAKNPISYPLKTSED